METKNTAKEVSTRMEKLIKGKAAELANLQADIDKAAQSVTDAENALTAAVEKTDLKAYQAAQTEKNTATTALEMYEARAKQLQEKEFVTEAESDSVIDEILAYEDAIEAEYIETMKKHLKTLADLCNDYKNRVIEAENVIKAWTGEIHANYRTFGTIYADGTNRGPRPVPVRNEAYTGGPAAHYTEIYLHKMLHAAQVDYLTEPK